MPLLQDAQRTRFKIVVSDNDIMVPALRTGELDVLLNYPPRNTTREGLIEETLYEDEFVVIASRTHRLAKLKRVTLHDLAGERWVLSESSLLAQQLLRRTFVERGLPAPEVVLETRSVGVKLNAVGASSLLDFSSRRTFEKVPQRSQLTILPVKELTWRRPVSLIYRDGIFLSSAIRRFIAKAKEAAQRLQPLA
jgi:DNA-binding transcriptional LysR family regulator